MAESSESEFLAAPVTWAPPALSAAVALFAPADLMSRFPMLASVGTFWIGIIPALDDYVRLSRIPEVTLLFFSVAWTIFPFQLVWTVGAILRRAKVNRTTLPRPVLVLLIGIVGIVVGLASLLFFARDPASVGSWGIASGRIGLAFWGTIQFVMISWFAGLVAAIVKAKWEGDI